MAQHESVGTGTQTATIDTEHTLDTETGGGTYFLQVDCNAMALGDELVLRVKTKTLTGSTSRLLHEVAYAHVQGEPNKIIGPIVAPHEIIFTLEQEAGTGRAYDFEVFRERVAVGAWRSTDVAAPTVEGVPEVDLTHLGGVVQSAIDLKDFADAGYDPATNKITGCVLTDTVTANTDMRGTDSAALASVLGALGDAAAAGDPTSADTLMQYVKQIINTLEGTVGMPVFPAEAAPANNVSLAEVIRAMAFDVAGLNGDVMRGTDGVDTATMRGTDSAALASVLGALADGAATGDPTAIDTVMQYVKQLVNLLAGTAGIATMPAGLDPANGVNLFEMLRAAMGATFAQATDSLEQLQADHVTLQGDIDDIQTRLPAALVGSRMDSDVAVIQTNAVSTAAMSAGAAQKIRDEILPTQNVAFSNLEFLFVAASDHVTPVTGASGTGVTRSIDGGSFGAGTGTLAEVGNGIYQYDASAADMNGGIITFRFTGTGGTPGAPDDRFVTVVTGGGV